MIKKVLLTILGIISFTVVAKFAILRIEKHDRPTATAVKGAKIGAFEGAKAGAKANTKITLTDR